MLLQNPILVKPYRLNTANVNPARTISVFLSIPSAHADLPIIASEKVKGVFNSILPIETNTATGALISWRLLNDGQNPLEHD